MGSDAHFKEMIGLTVNGIQAEKDLEAVLKAIKKNKTRALQTAYVPTPWLTDWAIKRLKASKQGVEQYINNNYCQPKRTVCSKMIKLVDYSPGKIDYFFQGLGYFSVSLALIYASIKQNLRTDF